MDFSGLRDFAMSDSGRVAYGQGFSLGIGALALIVAAVILPPSVASADTFCSSDPCSPCVNCSGPADCTWRRNTVTGAPVACDCNCPW